RAAVGAAQGLKLAVHFRAGDAATPIRGNTPPADEPVNAPALRNGFVVSHQHDKTASFSRPEAGGTLVIDAHFLRSECARFREADDFERIQTQVDATRQRDIQISSFERGASVSHGEQRRSAGTIDGVAAAL